jgi:hypothetical protein
MKRIIWNRIVISLIIILQLLGSIFGIGKDFRNSIPYSNSKSASIYIDSICKESCVLIADNSVYSSSISAYLKAKSIYSLPEQDFVTYKKWQNFDGEVSWNAISNALRKYPNSIALVSTLDLSKKPEELVLIRNFAPSIWGDNYSVYKLVTPSG